MNIIMLFLLSLLFTLSCSTDFCVDNGGTTEITNACISGVIYRLNAENDSVVVPNAHIFLRSLVSGPQQTTTDQNGRFVIDTVDIGEYWFEARSDDTLGFMQSLQIQPDDTSFHFSKIIKKVGGLRGQLKIDTTGVNIDSVFNNTKIAILEAGLSLSVDSNGVFEYNALSPFNSYTIVVSNVLFPEIEDTLKAGVQESTLTEINNVNRPPFFTHDETAMTPTAQFGVEYLDTVHAIDPDGDILYYELINGATNLELQDSVISWIPTKKCCKMKVLTVTVQVLDNNGGFDELSWTVTIEND